MSMLKKNGAWEPTGRDEPCIVKNQSGEAIWDNAIIARGVVTRGKGLIGQRTLKATTAMIFPKCSSVHCMFMSSAIDIVSLSDAGCILGIQTVKPWRKVDRIKGTKAVLEASAGACSMHGVRVGMQLFWAEKAA